MTLEINFKNFESNILEIIENEADKVLTDKVDIIRTAVQNEAKQWKAQAIRDLSYIRPGGAKTNTSDFPYRVSGMLSRSLHYRTSIRQVNSGIIKVSIFRDFTPVKGNATDDYGEVINQPGTTFGLYKDRIKARLDNAIIGLIRRII